MERVVSIFAVLLITLGGTSGAPLSNLPGATKDKSPSAQGKNGVAVKTITCDWASKSEIDSSKWVDDNAVKLALYEAVSSGRGIVKAKKACATFEGDPLPIYATAKRGKIKITRDVSQDRWLRFKGLIKVFGLNSYTTRKVEVGYFDQGKFIPLNGAPPNGRRLFLKLKGKEYF